MDTATYTHPPQHAKNVLIVEMRKLDKHLLANGFEPFTTEQRLCASDTTRTTESKAMFRDLFDRVLSGELARVLEERIGQTIFDSLDKMNPEAACVRAIQRVVSDGKPWDTDAVQAIVALLRAHNYDVPGPQPRDTVDSLRDELCDWCNAQDPCLPYTSADELLVTASLTDTQLSWLRAYIRRWDAVMEYAS